MVGAQGYRGPPFVDLSDGPDAVRDASGLPVKDLSKSGPHIGRKCVGTECTPETALEECRPYACLNGNCAPDCALGLCAEGYYQ